MTLLEFGFCTGGMLFPRRAIGPGDRTLCEDELRWVKRRPRSIEQAVFACSTRTDNEKKASRGHALALLVEPNVDSWSRLRDFTGRNVVDTRHGNCMDGIDTNAARSFNLSATVN